MSSSSRSIAAARQRRSGDTVQKPQQLQQSPSQQPMAKQGLSQKNQMKQAPQAAPRPKLSIGDAFGLVTLRLGRVEQFMYEIQQQGGIKSGEIPENSQVVDKTDTSVSYTFDSSVTSLNTWYYGGYSWYSGVQLNGPFTTGDKIIIKKVKL